MFISEDDLPVSFSAEECCGKYVNLHDIYREYDNFNFDSTTVNTTEANQGANPLELAAARHQSIDSPAFLQVSICPLPAARLPEPDKGRMQRVGELGRLNWTPKRCSAGHWQALHATPEGHGGHKLL